MIYAGYASRDRINYLYVQQSIVYCNVRLLLTLVQLVKICRELYGIRKWTAVFPWPSQRNQYSAIFEVTIADLTWSGPRKMAVNPSEQSRSADMELNQYSHITDQEFWWPVRRVIEQQQNINVIFIRTNWNTISRICTHLDWPPK
jgi:hypothetical protein